MALLKKLALVERRLPHFSPLLFARSLRDVVVDEHLRPIGLGGGSCFRSLGVQSTYLRALKTEGITTPTLVQAEALPITLSTRANCIINSETGTGKSLTFLLPALQDPNPGLTTLILTPSRELAVQLYYQGTLLAGKNKNSQRIGLLYSGVDIEETFKEFVKVKPHILIGTPKRILAMVCANSHLFKHLNRVVLDEVDRILMPLSRHAPRKRRELRELRPRQGATIVEKLLSIGSANGRNLQLICASATINRLFIEELKELGWGDSAEVISTIGRLTTPPEIKHLYVQCSDTTEDEEDVHAEELSDVEDEEKPQSTACTSEGEEGSTKAALGVHPSKIDTLVELFRSSGDKCALVFIHRGASINHFISALTERGIRATALYISALEPKKYSEFLEDFRSGEIQMVVDTEQTVRGLDFAWLNSVYIMEVPKTAKEYLHMCGRVGRVGKEGKATVIASTDFEVTRMNRFYTALGVSAEEVEDLSAYGHTHESA